MLAGCPKGSLERQQSHLQARKSYNCELGSQGNFFGCSQQPIREEFVTQAQLTHLQPSSGGSCRPSGRLEKLFWAQGRTWCLTLCLFMVSSHGCAGRFACMDVLMLRESDLAYSSIKASCSLCVAYKDFPHLPPFRRVCVLADCVLVAGILPSA